jgi:hypothetical protein
MAKFKGQGLIFIKIRKDRKGDSPEISPQRRKRGQAKKPRWWI